MSDSWGARLLAELLGTALLVSFGAGAVVAAHAVERDGLDYAGLGVVAISFAIAVGLAIYTTAPISGAHLNPAITLGLAAAGRFKWSHVLPYVLAQTIGACVGSLFIVSYVGRRATDLGGVGLTTLGAGVTPAQGIIAEALATFFVMLVVMAVAEDPRPSLGRDGMLVGLAVATQIMVIGAFTGGSVNPARTFGPYLINDLLGGLTPWSHLWVYVVGPVLGATIGALVHRGLVPSLRPTPAHRIHANINHPRSV